MASAQTAAALCQDAGAAELKKGKANKEVKSMMATCQT